MVHGDHKESDMTDRLTRSLSNKACQEDKERETHTVLLGKSRKALGGSVICQGPEG